MGDYWEKTIQLYENFIEYPQMTEKYLKRPPFKYLFQIFLSLNNKTKFASGLLKENELDPDYYDSPEKKMAFLKQVLKFVYKGLNKACPLKPQSVIKGVDCDKTNEFLQDMYALAASGKTVTKADSKADGDPGSPSLPTKGTALHNQKSNISNDKENGSLPKESSNKAKEKLPKLATQVTKEIESFDTNTTNKVGKENHREASKDSKIGKVSKNVKDTQSKEDKLLAKEKEGKSSAENSIKMGSLTSTTPQNRAKNPINNLSLGIETNPQDAKGLQLDGVKELIQKITQNVNPLGKLVEFIEDDLDGMNKEYKKWQKLYFESSSALEKIEAEQDEELQTYHDKLIEINDQLFDMETKISSIRSRILKNNAKTESMLSKIISN